MLFAKFEIKTLLSCWFFDDVRKPQCSCSKTCQTEARSASLQCYRISFFFLTGGDGVLHRSVKVTPPTKTTFFTRGRKAPESRFRLCFFLLFVMFWISWAVTKPKLGYWVLKWEFCCTIVIECRVGRYWSVKVGYIYWCILAFFSFY